MMQSDRLFVKCRPNFNVKDQIAHLAMISHCHCQIQKTRHLSDGRSSQKKKPEDLFVPDKSRQTLGYRKKPLRKSGAADQH